MSPTSFSSSSLQMTMLRTHSAAHFLENIHQYISKMYK